MNALAADWRVEVDEAIVSLPMYDLPELREAHDALWRALQGRLLAVGVVRTCEALQRGQPGDEAWANPRLLLTQICGYPLALGRREPVRLVATPGYLARGCQGPYHRSVVIVRLNDRAVTLADTRGYRLAINATDSNTGVNLLRADVAPLAKEWGFFGGVTRTGAHVRSVASVVEGAADLAAVDCVTWAHLERFAPSLCARLRVLTWSRASPGLPLVTGPLTTEAEVSGLRETLDEVARDPQMQDVHRTLLLDRFYRVPRGAYQVLADLADSAAEQGYAELS